jgi:hypothetical protein
MNAANTPRHKTAKKPLSPATRPVTEVLLELAYQLHATRVVEKLEKPRPSRTRSI